MKLPFILQWLLWPFSLLYGAAVTTRAWLYRIGVFRQKRLDAVVISVGNLTVGGTGKTPMVIWLAKQLRKRHKLAVLTRGYGAKAQAPQSKVVTLRTETVQVGNAAVKETRLESVADSAAATDSFADDRGSDEVQVMHAHFAGSIPIGVGEDRYQTGTDFVRRGFTCFVLDDGLQHQRLARDAEIILVDALDPFGGGHLLPAGGLREPLSGLARADVVVVTRASEAPALVSMIRRYTRAPVFFAQTALDEVRVQGGGEQPVDWRQKKLLAFCGIGNPAAFFQDLEGWGFALTEKVRFPDHHHYTKDDLKQIESRAIASGADSVICTEKDIANLPARALPTLPLGYARISLRINKPGEFLLAVESAVSSRRMGFLL